MKRSVSINSSAAIIVGNDDLLTEILLFLPAKSLIRFELVSKRWRTLISSASFSRLHTLHHCCRRRPEPQHSFVLRLSKSQFFVCNPTAKSLVPFEFPSPCSVKILQSCNGLLLLQRISSRPIFQFYYVFNPTTKQLREFYLSRPTGIYLMFDPSKSEHYRILCVRRKQNPRSFSVYDSQTREWEESVTSVDGNCNFGNGVYCNGSIYFIGYGHEASFCYSSEDNLQRCPNPPLIGSPVGKKNCILESNGHLHFVRLCTWPRTRTGIWKVYEMIDDEWLVKDGNQQFKADNVKVDLVGMIRAEKVEDSVLLYHVPGKIRIYRFLDRADEVLVDFTRDNFYQEGLLQFRFKDAHPLFHVLAPV